jgi:hypothetical protein
MIRVTALDQTQYRSMNAGQASSLSRSCAGFSGSGKMLCKHDRQDAYPTVCLNGIAIRPVKTGNSSATPLAMSINGPVRFVGCGRLVGLGRAAAHLLLVGTREY